MIPLIMTALFIVLVSLLIWWLIFASEGVYLGPRMVRWLYDIYATRYDNIKQNDPEQDHMYLAHPLMMRLEQNDPFVLDVATGTARLPLTLCSHSGFEGYIIGVDASEGMLKVGEQNILEAGCEDVVTLMHRSAEKLPFANAAFDVVTCLEALEFMPDPAAQLAEMCRVLRPGGVLLTTQRVRTRLYPGRVWDQAIFRHHLESNGVEQIMFIEWQYDYTLVWGRKAGQSEWIGPRLPEEVIVS
jgi:ubiquinone/menaquinone biosynthesis C-methylase UbiE